MYTVIESLTEEAAELVKKHLEVIAAKIKKDAAEVLSDVEYDPNDAFVIHKRSEVDLDPIQQVQAVYLIKWHTSDSYIKSKKLTQELKTKIKAFMESKLGILGEIWFIELSDAGLIGFK